MRIQTLFLHMSTGDKIRVVVQFLEAEENFTTSDPHKQNLYNLVFGLRLILENQLAIQNNLMPQAFVENDVYLTGAISYLAVPGHNDGQETSLMVRYLRNYLETINDIPIQGDELPHFGRPPRLERVMNINSPFM